MLILGAGLSGCIAAYKFPNVTVIERASPESIKHHSAVLRFRTSAVSDITGIPFQKVTVHKGIYFDGNYVQPNIELANMYSRKVTGSILNRSIWDIETAERFVAPNDFHNHMLSVLDERVLYREEAASYLKNELYGPFISTLPMNVVSNILGVSVDACFGFREIHTERYHVPGCDVHQTVYFPHYELGLYRATLTGSDLILESIKPIVKTDRVMAELAFGIDHLKNDDLCSGQSSQQYGKIKPIPDSVRKAFIHKLSTEHNVYSLGRFATWKNILLDDVVKDIEIIKDLMSQDEYYRRLKI